MRKALITLSAFVGLAACQSTPEQSRSALQMVPVSEAIALLDATCGATRPDFSGVEARFQARGLTRDMGVAWQSETKALVGRVTEMADGTPICWVGGTYEGDLIALQNELASRYGGARHSDVAYFGAVRVPEYNRGAKGKMLINLGNSRAGAATAEYLLGIVGG